jgi:hypothetical protein
MGGRIHGLELLLLYAIGLVALFTKVKVKAVVTLVADVCDRQQTAPITLDSFLLEGLPGLHDDLDAMFISVVAADLEALIRGGEVAILTKAEVRTVRADKASTNYGLHIAATALVLVVSG